MQVNTKNGVSIFIDENLNETLDITKLYFDKSNGYVKYKGKYIHRILTGASTGQVVDHINRNKLDNRKENLRICSSKINAYNKDIQNKHGRGVYFDKWGDRYRACISHNNRTLKLGSFKTAQEAQIAYNKASIEMYGADAYVHDVKLPDAPHFQV